MRPGRDDLPADQQDRQARADRRAAARESSAHAQSGDDGEERIHWQHVAQPDIDPARQADQQDRKGDGGRLELPPPIGAGSRATAARPPATRSRNGNGVFTASATGKKYHHPVVRTSPSRYDLWPARFFAASWPRPWNRAGAGNRGTGPRGPAPTP